MAEQAAVAWAAARMATRPRRRGRRHKGRCDGGCSGRAAAKTACGEREREVEVRVAKDELGRPAGAICARLPSGQSAGLDAHLLGLFDVVVMPNSS